MRTDPAWTTCPEVWGVNGGIGKRSFHRISKVALQQGSGTHGLAECGVYLMTVDLRVEPSDDVDICDACLMGDTEFQVVYTWWDADGAPIYVGSTADLPTRTQTHVRDSLWWTRDLTLTFEMHDSIEAARTAEAETIRALKPVNNVRADGSGRRGAPSQMATLHIRREVLARYMAEGLGVSSGSAAPDSTCAWFLGIATNTYWRVRTDPDYSIGGGLVAQLIRMFGFEALPELLETRDQTINLRAA
jgi:hypothetical protein